MTKDQSLFIAVVAMALLGCSNSDDKNAFAEITSPASPPKQNNTYPALPRCNATNVEIINFNAIRLGNDRAVFRKSENAEGKETTCRGDSIGFTRFLGSDGSWGADKELLSLQKSSGVKALAAANIVVLRVVDRKTHGQNEFLSRIGAPQKFPGVAFTKWVADENSIQKFNLEHSDRPIGNSPQWSIDGSTDDQTGRPVNISCTPGNLPNQQGDENYLSAGRLGRNASCAMWFAVDFGKDSRASVKISISGEASMAGLVIENTRKELVAKIQEVAK